MSYVLGPTEGHFSASCCVRVKMISEKGPKHIYAKEHKLYHYYYNFGGHWEIMKWKKKIQSEISILYTVKCATLRDRLMITCSFQFLVYIFSFPVKGFKSTYRRTSTDKQLSTATVCSHWRQGFLYCYQYQYYAPPTKVQNVLTSLATALMISCSL